MFENMIKLEKDQFLFQSDKLNTSTNSLNDLEQKINTFFEYIDVLHDVDLSSVNHQEFLSDVKLGDEDPIAIQEGYLIFGNTFSLEIAQFRLRE
ncbi:hypothetical protein MKX54_20435 [Alkalihalobacillus sp. FSL R5-0424]